jgi:hypothetical protein
MNKTVKQLEQELAAMTGERNAWREMAQTLVAKPGLPFVTQPQLVPVYIQPQRVPQPWEVTWTTSGNNTTCNSTGVSLHVGESEGSDEINFSLGSLTSVGDPNCTVTVEEIRNHLDTHQN